MCNQTFRLIERFGTLATVTRVSKRPLEPGVSEQLFTQLSAVLGQLDQDRTDRFLSDLLGPEERIVLAKRLATILMLASGCSLYKTATTLAISSSTAKSVHQKLQAGAYDQLLAALRKKQNKHVLLELLETVDNILHLGGLLPRYNGLDRYRI